MKIEIKHRYTDNVLYVCYAENLKEAVIEAISKNINLSGADLHGADLSGANLHGADLGGANLGGTYLSCAYLGGEKLAICPISMSGTTWDILISESYLVIGCQRHTHGEWKTFTMKEIAEMESRASKFWTANKSWLLSACEAHRKESLAYRKSNPINGETK